MYYQNVTKPASTIQAFRTASDASEQELDHDDYGRQPPPGQPPEKQIAAFARVRLVTMSELSKGEVDKRYELQRQRHKILNMWSAMDRNEMMRRVDDERRERMKKDEERRNRR
jgi:hypothetical protein